MRLFRLISTVLMGAAVSTAAMAQSATADVTRAPGKVTATKSVEITADITAIDAATRGVTLKGPEGNEVELTAGPEVRNFDQLKVGDKVQMQYVEQLELELIKGGGRPVVRSEAGGGARAAQGEAPAGMVAAQVTTIGDVIALDPSTRTVTLKGPERTVDLVVEDPEQFKLIALGDQIQATLTAAVGIAASTPAAK
jgi:hypothetical protein